MIEPGERVLGVTRWRSEYNAVDNCATFGRLHKENLADLALTIKPACVCNRVIKCVGYHRVFCEGCAIKGFSGGVPFPLLVFHKVVGLLWCGIFLYLGDVENMLGVNGGLKLGKLANEFGRPLFCGQLGAVGACKTLFGGFSCCCRDDAPKDDVYSNICNGNMPMFVKENICPDKECGCCA